MRKQFFVAIFALMFGISATANAAGPDASRLEGKILLQVESRGEAWYVHQGERRYMPDGTAAYGLMRFLGLGITDADLAIIPAEADPETLRASSSTCSSNELANRIKGRIALQVQQNGEAWYVDVDTCRRIYMKDGDAAYEIMRYLSLGISNDDLSAIPVSPLSIRVSAEESVASIGGDDSAPSATSEFATEEDVAEPAPHPESAGWRVYQNRIAYFTGQIEEALDDYAEGKRIHSWDERGALERFQSCASTARTQYESSIFMPSYYAVSGTDQLRQTMGTVSQKLVQVCDLGKILALANGDFFYRTESDLERAFREYELYRTLFDNYYKEIVDRAVALGYDD